MSQAQALIKAAQSYLGVAQGSERHRYLVDCYNRIQPLPQGYRVTYQDDWCDVFVSALAYQQGLGQLIGAECGVERHVKLFKQKGIWHPRQAAYQPQMGDIIVFDWDGAGFADHIGFVLQANQAQVTTIEGNTNHSQVGSHTYRLQDWRIKGYARPCYTNSTESIPVPDDQVTRRLVREVIRGEWGNGLERVRRLKAAGYLPEVIQAAVNRQLQLGKLNQ